MFTMRGLQNTVAMSVDALTDGSYTWMLLVGGAETTGSTKHRCDLEGIWINALDLFSKNFESSVGALSEDELGDLEIGAFGKKLKDGVPIEEQLKEK